MRNKPAPPAKWTIRDRLLRLLYDPMDVMRSQDIAALIERNTALLQADDIAVRKVVNPDHFHRSFAYNGEFYSIDPNPAPAMRNRLHSSLEQAMRDHVDLYGQRLTEEKLLVTGYFNSMLAFSNAPGDWLQLLPETLRDPLKAMVITESWAESRTPEDHAAFLERHNPRFELIRQRMTINLLL